jgi:guanylate cyclase
MDILQERDKRIKEKSFLLMVPLFVLAGLIWAIVYYYYGAKRSAFIPGGYSVFSFLSYLFYRWKKHFDFFRNTHLVLILLLPCLLHLSLGDFVSSSAVIIWAILCPLGALAFHNTRAATYWLFLFLAALAATFFLEGKIIEAGVLLPAWLIRLLFALNISAVTFLTFFVLRYFVNQTELAKEQLQHEQALLAAEREKSEKLLLNILPAAIANRLKDGETVIADEYLQAAILFADIVGFTKTTQNISAPMLVENLNKIFTHFDELVEKFKLEKIKTIGDSYMVVSGIIEPRPGHLNAMADLALAMAANIHQFTLDGKTNCDIRIGIDTGPVIAGVIGSKKFTYDVWGDVVNTASRLESSGEPGKIQVSEKFYEQIKTDYLCEYRGEKDIRSKGAMKLYFLTGKA